MEPPLATPIPRPYLKVFAPRKNRQQGLLSFSPFYDLNDSG